MKKLIFLFFFFSTTYSFGSVKSEIISKLNLTKNLKFNFEQKVNEKIEKGSCTIHYPKKIFCQYDDFFKKILVSNGKSLLINSNKHNQYFRYSLDKTPLNFILDKEFIIARLNEIEIDNSTLDLHKFEILYEGLEVSIYFSKKTLDLVGWSTTDIYQNNVETRLSSVETNILVDEKIFDIRKYIN